MTAPALPIGHNLADLLAGLVQVAPAQQRSVTGLALDSRQVRPGSLFAAVAGSQRHGLEFVAQALQRGAAAVVYEPDSRANAAAAERACAAAGVPLLAVPGLGQSLSLIAGRFFDHPSRGLTLLGVTGTDGKTSVSQFIVQALSETAPCGVIGTLGYGQLGSLEPASHTTPDAIRLQQLLNDMRGSGIRHVAMEVSSHALDQGRVAALRFRVAVLTNLSRDHLDYHGSQEAYAAAKARLFAMPGLEHAILNADDEFGRRLLASLPDGVRALTYSLSPAAGADLVCQKLHARPNGLELQLRTPFGGAELSLPLLGRFNAANALAALGALLALEVPLPEAVRRLQRLRPVAGRMQRLGGGGQPQVVIDYAHTPAALAAALDAVREHTEGRVWCVFGCGGERDAGKRAAMGAVADAKADVIVITDDNPRREDPEAIFADILAGVQRQRPQLVHDRAAAIRLALEQAEAGDTVLIAGKGHEDYQLVGERRLAFNDAAVAVAVLQERAAWID